MTASCDPSFRYVLPPGAPLLRNLAALWGLDPALAAAVESHGPVTHVRAEPARTGASTLVVARPDGRQVYLHSKYDPLAEAARLVDSMQLDGKVAFHLHGLGLGYHLELLFDRASDEAIFCIYEPDLVLLRAALETHDLSRVLSSKRLLFFWTPDKSNLFLKLTPHSALLSVGQESVKHAPCVALAPQFHDQIEQWISEFASFCETSVNTLVLNGKRTAENITRNIAWYAAAPGIGRLRNRYAGKPAIVVSAGPSLRKNKHHLKDVGDKAVVIAVQTMFKPLLEMGIEPQFVTSLDYHDICTRFFENLPATVRTELVAEPKATNKIFGMNPGPVSLLGNEYADALVPELKLNKPRLPAGATVAHLAYYLAEHMGCDPIIFVGQDLGFSAGLCYSPGTSYEDVWRPELGRFCTMEMKQWEHIVRDRSILRKIPDHEGRPMYTEERLFTYLQQFERDFVRSRARIIDATEGGAAKRGATPMKLADAIAQFCTQPLAAPADDYPPLQWERLGACIESLRKRRAEAEQIEEISRQTLPLLEDVHAHLDDQARVNRAIAKLDGLRARMAGLKDCYELIMQLTQTTELRRFKEDRSIAAAKVTGLERQRRQAARDIENVRGVVEAAGQFCRLIDEMVEQLNQQQSSHRTSSGTGSQTPQAREAA